MFIIRMIGIVEVNVERIIKNGLSLLKRDFVICQIGCRFLVIPIEFYKGEYIANFETC